MPIVRIELFPGRSPALKADLARHITAGFADLCGTRPADVTIQFIEIAPQDWFIAAGPSLSPT